MFVRHVELLLRQILKGRRQLSQDNYSNPRACAPKVKYLVLRHEGSGVEPFGKDHKAIIAKPFYVVAIAMVKSLQARKLQTYISTVVARW